MKHYIVEIDYRVAIERVEQSTADHRAHLQTGYERGLLLCSGPKVPRTGGFLVARAATAVELESFIEADPFKSLGLADYRITEFAPVKYQMLAQDWFAPS